MPHWQESMKILCSTGHKENLNAAIFGANVKTLSKPVIYGCKLKECCNGKYNLKQRSRSPNCFLLFREEIMLNVL